MVGKLFKYEMRAYARTLLPIELILIAVGFCLCVIKKQ